MYQQQQDAFQRYNHQGGVGNSQVGVEEGDQVSRALFDRINDILGELHRCKHDPTPLLHPGDCPIDVPTLISTHSNIYPLNYLPSHIHPRTSLMTSSSSSSSLSSSSSTTTIASSLSKRMVAVHLPLTPEALESYVLSRLMKGTGVERRLIYM